MNTDDNWKQVVMAYFKVPSQYLHEEPKETHKNHNQDSK